MAVVVAAAIAIPLLTSSNSSTANKTETATPSLAGDTGPVRLIGEALVTGLVRQLASSAFGDALQAVGFGDQVDTQVLNALNQIQAQLTKLQTSVDEITKALTQATYDKWASDVIPIANAVTDTFMKLDYIATNNDKSAIPQVDDSIKGLIDSHALVILNSDLMGAAATTGAYRAWSNLIKSKSPFWGPSQSDALFAYFDYYDTVQAQLIYLIRDYDLATGITENFFVDNDLATYNRQRDAQLALRNSLQAAPAVIDIRTNLMWPAKLPFVFRLPYCAETNGGQQVSCKFHYSQMTMPNATSYLKSLNDYRLDGFSDWRLPTVGELRSLAGGQSDPRGYLVTQFGTDTVFAICGSTCTNIPVWTSDAGKLPPCTIGGCYPAHQVFDVSNNGTKMTADFHNDATIWPVRAVTAGEKYWLS